MPDTMVADAVVIGAGIAGASAAYFLARFRRVVVLEREAQPGYHTSGRSAAMFCDAFGSPSIRALGRTSGGFLRRPPAGFADTAVATARAVLFTGRADQAASLAALRAAAPDAAMDLLGPAAAQALVPVLRAETVAAGAWRIDALALDVHALLTGYLRGVRAHGGRIVTDAEVGAIDRAAGNWIVTTGSGRFAAPVLVNAAGAWSDPIAMLAGVAPLGVQSLRRTAITIDVPPGLAVGHWPMVNDVDDRWYFKPEAGGLMASPADESPSPPCDARPEEEDVAGIIARIEEVTTLRVRRPRSTWAGLRNFTCDRDFAIGFDPTAEGFFWLTGQGGSGVLTSPAAGRLAAELIADGRPSLELIDAGVSPAALSPARFRTDQDCMSGFRSGSPAP